MDSHRDQKALGSAVLKRQHRPSLFILRRYFFDRNDFSPERTENTGFFQDTCKGKENNRVNGPHNQILQSPSRQDCQEPFSVQHIQP